MNQEQLNRKGTETESSPSDSSPRLSLPSKALAAEGASVVDFSFALAAQLCQLSAMAYGSNPAPHFNSEPHWIESTSGATRVLILRWPQDVIVAFRGTADLRNWLTDLDCKFVRQNGCHIHAGFAHALESVRERTVAEILQAMQRCEGRPRLWLTGHSLGGALAMLFAWTVVQRYGQQPFSGVYTFGQPRAGDRLFRDSYDYSGLRGRTFRVVHSADLVPHLPCLLGLYRHPGREIFFNDAGRWQEDAPFSWHAMGEAAANLHRLLHFRAAALADHHIATYLELFEDSARTEEEASVAPTFWPNVPA